MRLFESSKDEQIILSDWRGLAGMRGYIPRLLSSLGGQVTVVEGLLGRRTWLPYPHPTRPGPELLGCQAVGGSKMAVVAFGEELSLELGEKGRRVIVDLFFALSCSVHF